MLVEAREDGGGDEDLASSAPASTASAAAPAGVGVQAPAPAAAAPPPRRAAPESTPSGDDDGEEEESLPASPMSMQDGIKAVQRALNEAVPPPRWPMYVRQAKQFLRNAIENFDERKYGFASVVDLLRAAGKEGVVRIERDRQGAVRVFPGNNLTPKTVHTGLPMDDEDGDETATGVVVDEPIADVDVDVSAPLPAEEELPAAEPMVFASAETVTEPPIVDAEPLDTDDESEGEEVNGNRIDIEPSRTISKRKTTSRRTGTTGRVTARAPRVTKTPTRARKTGGRK
jgi:hypothetical protein